MRALNRKNHSKRRPGSSTNDFGRSHVRFVPKFVFEVLLPSGCWVNAQSFGAKERVTSRRSQDATESCDAQRKHRARRIDVALARSPGLPDDVGGHGLHPGLARWPSANRSRDRARAHVRRRHGSPRPRRSSARTAVRRRVPPDGDPVSHPGCEPLACASDAHAPFTSTLRRHSIYANLNPTQPGGKWTERRAPGLSAVPAGTLSESARDLAGATTN